MSLARRVRTSKFTKQIERTAGAMMGTLKAGLAWARRRDKSDPGEETTCSLSKFSSEILSADWFAGDREATEHFSHFRLQWQRHAVQFPPGNVGSGGRY